jgi:hypothetical protein
MDEQQHDDTPSAPARPEDKDADENYLWRLRAYVLSGANRRSHRTEYEQAALRVALSQSSGRLWSAAMVRQQTEEVFR